MMSQQVEKLRGGKREEAISFFRSPAVKALLMYNLSELSTFDYKSGIFHIICSLDQNKNKMH